MNLLEDWKRARDIGTRTLQQVGIGTSKWSKPTVGWPKINVDAAMLSGKCVGLGVVIRDSTGHFLRARCG